MELEEIKPDVRPFNHLNFPNFAGKKIAKSSRKSGKQRRTGKILLGELNIICPNETCWSQMHKMILS